MLRPIIVAKFAIYGSCLVTHTLPDLFRIRKNETENNIIISHKMIVNLICVSVSAAMVFTIVAPKAKYTTNEVVTYRRGRCKAGSIQLISKINPTIHRATHSKFSQENTTRNYYKKYSGRICHWLGPRSVCSICLLLARKEQGQSALPRGKGLYHDRFL